MRTSTVSMILCAWLVVGLGHQARALEISPYRINVGLGGHHYKIPYYRTSPLSGTTSASRVVVVIHGAGTPGPAAYNGMRTAANRAGATADTEIFAPQYISRADADTAGLGSDVLTWSSSGWKYGDWSDTTATNDRITSYALVDLIVRYVVNHPGRYPNVREIVVAGHSAGGQFVNRYAAGNGIESTVTQAGMHMRYIVANPSAYLYFDTHRAEPGSLATFRTLTLGERAACPGYNDYLYGLHDRYGYLASVGTATIRDRFRSRTVHMLLGEEDNSPCAEGLDTSCAADWQGSQRQERGLVYHNYLRLMFGAAVYSNHTLQIVPGAGHGSRAMFSSRAGIRVIFDRDLAEAVTVTPFAPYGTVYDDTPEYQWYAEPLATRYHLEVFDRTGRRVNRSLRPVDVGCAHGGLCSWTLAISLNDGACAMRLTPTLPAGFAASSSEMLFSVNLPGLVTLKGPTGAQTDHTPTYTWEMDPGASRYQLTVTDRATGMTVVNRTYDASDACPCGDDCRITPPDALADGRFLWQLRPGDPDEWGTWRSMSFSLSTPLTPSNGAYSLKVDSTGKCLDADSSRDHLNGGAVQLWSCNGWDNQYWQISHLGGNHYTASLVSTGKCLDADSSEDHLNGGRVQVWDCNGWMNQQWTIDRLSDGRYAVTVDSTGKCLDADSGEDHLNGGTVQLWSCHFGSNQSWRLERRNSEEF